MMRTQPVSPGDVPAPAGIPVVCGDVPQGPEGVVATSGDVTREAGEGVAASGDVSRGFVAASGNVVAVSEAAVEIRPARPGDEEGIRRFLGGLSPRTRALRFFAGMSHPSASFVRTLLAVDDRRDALLAVRGNVLVGHAMSCRGEEVDVEIAVVVSDEWQGTGIGSRLIRTLMRRAEARGAVTVGMDVLGDNREVLSMVRRMWPEATMRASSGMVEVTAQVLR
ncbi:GNAT family N-acetyltransferase [Streptosporangium sp. NPDC006930]|uniref:GNAT family N-acetyltransferase n=1 Tax=Streptosporangium sp. NPDC006930 TaxID=3154783 RepID=UPI003433AC85